MKILMIVITMVICFVTNNTFAQASDNTDSKSSTTSGLCTAQENIIKGLFNGVYDKNDKFDIWTLYDEAVKPETAKCLMADIALWGEFVKTNAQECKFQKFNLSFEKPNEVKMEVPRAAIRSYKKAFNAIKKEFIKTRKTKTLDDILNETYLSKKLGKTNAALKKQMQRAINAVSR